MGPADSVEEVVDLATRLLPELRSGGFGPAVAEASVGTSWTHASGYTGRILKADFTDDGQAIVPGLRVRTNNNWWGYIWPEQFLAEGLTAPGGSCFEGWYEVCKDDDHAPYYRFNSERLSTKEMT
jgi:hypothetical protein